MGLRGHAEECFCLRDQVGYGVALWNHGVYCKHAATTLMGFLGPSPSLFANLALRNRAQRAEDF
jgi:hypothetical protein